MTKIILAICDMFKEEIQINLNGEWKKCRLSTTSCDPNALLFFETLDQP